MHGVIPSRRKGEESMMSTHGSAASASVATLVRLEALVLSPVLWRIVTATLAAAMALCLVQPVGAQSPAVAFAIPYTGTLKKINDSAKFASAIAKFPPSRSSMRSESRGVLARSLRNRRREVVAEQRHPVVRRPVTPKPLRACHLRRSRSRMRVDHEQSRTSQDDGFFADHVRRWRSSGASRQRHPEFP
jgi:hypothetical protein